MTLAEEIAETEKLDQHETVSFSISLLRSLYLHGLYAMRDGDYASFSAVVGDLLRRDKHVRNQKPDHLVSVPADVHNPAPEGEKRIGYEKEGKPIFGKLLPIALSGAHLASLL